MGCICTLLWSKIRLSYEDEDSWSLRNQSTPAELRGRPLRLTNASLRFCRRWLAVPVPSSRCALHARAEVVLIAVIQVVLELDCIHEVH